MKEAYNTSRRRLFFLFSRDFYLLFLANVGLSSKRQDATLYFGFRYRIPVLYIFLFFFFCVVNTTVDVFAEW